MLSFTEENYLKALFKALFEHGHEAIGTNALAVMLQVKPATVNDMLKKLKEKKLVDYEKYGKIKLTTSGKKAGIEVLRKHRLWETFLYEKLGFGWEEIHEVAEQLEHIQSQKLIDSLEHFLAYPEFDPHGDPIPSKSGKFKTKYKRTLAEMEVGECCRIVAVKDNSSSFLQYVSKVGLQLRQSIRLMGYQEFDGSLEIAFNGKTAIIGQKLAQHIMVVCEACQKGDPMPSRHCYL